MLVVGGHGYVGGRVVHLAQEAGDEVEVISREGGTVRGQPSMAWSRLRESPVAKTDGVSIVWLLDGAKHYELERLRDLLAWAPRTWHLVMVSTCTVYGDAHGVLCDEAYTIDLRTAHARLKAEGERLLAGSALTWCVQRLGALYGVDDRSVRADRVEKWVTSAATTGVVSVPDPDHWRGWLHREQAARALWRAARGRIEGTYNVASVNLTFGQAAGAAAEPFSATVCGETEPDPCNYQVDATRARSSRLLDERAGEDLVSVVRDFVRERSAQLPGGAS